MQNSIKEFWVLLAATIIIGGAVKGIVQWRIRMFTLKRCEEIINDFNKLWPNPKPVGSASWLYLLTDKNEKYKLSVRKARRCIEYLKEKGFIREDKNDPTETYWIRQ